MNGQDVVKPVDSIEELLRFIGIARTEARKIKEEPILAEFTERLKKEGYNLPLMEDFAARLRIKGYDPNYIAGAISVLLGRRAEEAKKEYTLERVVKTIEKLPGKITEQLSKISLYTTSIIWFREVPVDLSKPRSSPQLLGYYPEGGDCIVALPDSTGHALIRADSSTAHGYGMGSIYAKIRVPFVNLYVENTGQPGKYLYLILGKGDISFEKWS